MKGTEAVEGVATEACGWSLSVFRQIGELDSVVGEHGMDAIRNGLDECFEEGSGGSHVCLFDELNHNEL